MSFAQNRFFYLCIFAVLSARDPAWSGSIVSPGKQTILFAEELDHNQETGITTARGNVEMEHGGRVLYADSVSYDEKKDRVSAHGNIRIFEATGEILFLDHAELSGDMKEGFVRKIRLILADDARLVAATAKRDKGNRSIFDRSVYTPCHVCKKDPERDPLWKIRSRRTLWDETTEDMIHTDAIMDIKGVPVFYLPWLRHPAPNVKRRTGFLSPFFGSSNSEGAFFGAPWFWAIDRSSDATLTPTWVGGNPMLGFEYRKQFAKAFVRVSGSVTNDRRSPTEKQTNGGESYLSGVRGHIHIDTIAELNDQWRAGADINRVSDRTYFKKYGHLGMTGERMLKSNVWLEGFHDRSYTNIQGHMFQGLRQTDVASETPIILPRADWKYISRPDRWGGVWTLDGNVLALSRVKGNDMQRLSVTGGWYVPCYLPGGVLLTSGVKVRSDYYNVSGYQFDSSRPEFDGSLGRGFANIWSNAEWPFIKILDSTRFVIEPKMGIVVSPNVGQSEKLPNEDSRVIELNELNLMNESRFAGLDRIDGGSRLNYGINMGAYTQNFGNTDLFIGQSYAVTQPREYLRGSGMEKKASDYVVRLKFSLGDWMSLNMRMLMDKKNLSSRRMEFSGLFGKPVLRAGIDYLLLPASRDLSEGRNEQARASLQSQITDFWSARIQVTRQLGGGRRQTLSEGIGIKYADECLTMDTTVEKSFYKDNELKPGIIVMVRLIFKNLGEFQQEL